MSEFCSKTLKFVKYVQFHAQSKTRNKSNFCRHFRRNQEN